MGRLFNPDSLLMRLLSRITDIILLNVLWITLSLPIVTFGAATTAVFDVALRWADGNEVPVVSTFFRAFIRNFRQSTALWVILALVGALAAGDLYITLCTDITGVWNTLLFPMSILLGVLWLMVMCWVFALQAHFENPVSATLKNALLVALSHFPSTLLFALAAMGSLLLTLAFPAILPFWAFLGYALAACLLAGRYLSILKKLESLSMEETHYE